MPALRSRAGRIGEFEVTRSRTALAAAIISLLASAAAAQDAAQNNTPDTNKKQEAPQNLGTVHVKDKALHDDTRPKLEHIMKEVDGELITVTKKTSITKLDNIPTVIDNNLRDLFAQTPGLYLSEQQTGSQFNL